MPIVLKKIKNVELRVQWSGSWDPFYNGANGAFPGIEIPLGLVGLINTMKGMSIQVDTADYKPTCEKAVSELFQSVIDVEGPGNARWTVQDAAWTINNHIRWLGVGADSLAFRVGTQDLTPVGTIDSQAPTKIHEDAYDFGANHVGRANYWICFSFE